MESSPSNSATRSSSGTSSVLARIAAWFSSCFRSPVETTESLGQSLQASLPANRSKKLASNAAVAIVASAASAEDTVTMLSRPVKRRLLLGSSSTVYGFGYLDHLEEAIKQHFGTHVKRVLFVPYAQKDYDAYTQKARERFLKMGYMVDGVHEDWTVDGPKEAVRRAEAIFIGGGNTFRLLTALYKNGLIEEIRKRVLVDGIPYMGTSAGTNVATINIKTTNDMPIVYPPTYAALGLVPFNINPHYLDPEPESTHMGETREQRINEFHEEADNNGPVLGLREPTWLLVNNDTMVLQGKGNMRLFRKNVEPVEIPVGSRLDGLLQI